MRNGTNMPKVLSLFSGGGGLDIGFHDAGYKIVGCVEIVEQFCNTLLTNCKKGTHMDKDTVVCCEDIRLFDATRFAGMGIECVIGGPPCQPFSAAGRRVGGVTGMQSEKGMLFESYCKVLSIIKPKVFVFENVYGLKGANKGDAWSEIYSAFSNLGYHIVSEILDAADYGVPQHRERLILVGSLDGTFVFPLPTHGPDSPTNQGLVSVGDAIKDLQQADDKGEDIGGMYGHLLPLVPEGLNYAFFTKEMGYPQPLFAWRSKFHDFLHKADRNEPSRTLKAQPGKFTGPFHWNNRHFTIEELKRIQSFPDDYALTGNRTQIMMQIGNSVPPRLAHVLATSIKQQLLRPAEQQTYPMRPANFKSTFRQRQRESTLKYKEIARKEIEKRFGRQTEEIKDWNYSNDVYFVYQSMFHKQMTSTQPKETLLQPAFHLSTHSSNGLLLSRMEQLMSLSGLNLEINITGLQKYLQKIDAINMKASIESAIQVFCAWDAIQEEMVRVSQFFSLIDIYGHYANRGDTVKVETHVSPHDEEIDGVLNKAIEFFGNSEHCGIFLSKNEVAEQLGIELRQLSPLLNKMRSLRYDVRTADTHPTITTDNVLCTYPFPMLSEKAMFERGLIR